VEEAGERHTVRAGRGVILRLVVDAEGVLHGLTSLAQAKGLRRFNDARYYEIDHIAQF
jgi:hypothetical protein